MQLALNGGEEDPHLLQGMLLAQQLTGPDASSADGVNGRLGGLARPFEVPFLGWLYAGSLRINTRSAPVLRAVAILRVRDPHPQCNLLDQCRASG